MIYYKKPMKPEILNLNLRSALLYVPDEGLEPFKYNEGEKGFLREKLFCFELDENEYLSIEPDKDRLLGRLVFGGQAAGTVQDEGKTLELPEGNYLFAQMRQLLNREEIGALAVEIQQEALWQRLRPGKLLYLRYLFEDNSPVTQLFRPV